MTKKRIPVPKRIDTFRVDPNIHLCMGNELSSGSRILRYCGWVSEEREATAEFWKVEQINYVPDPPIVVQIFKIKYCPFCSEELK